MVRQKIQTDKTVNEFNVSRALRVAVTSSVLCTGLVGWEPGYTTIGVHLREVDGTIETTREVGDVDIECEFLVEEFEDLVFAVAGHQVDTRANVLSVRVVLDELESESVSAGGDTVGVGVVGTIDSAVCSTGGGVRANRGVPGVASVTVGGRASFVDPAPVGVESNRTSGLTNAATGGGTFLPGKSWVGLRRVGTDLLTKCDGEEGEGEKCGFVEHCGCECQ